MGRELRARPNAPSAWDCAVVRAAGGERSDAFRGRLDVIQVSVRTQRHRPSAHPLGGVKAVSISVRPELNSAGGRLRVGHVWFDVEAATAAELGQPGARMIDPAGGGRQAKAIGCSAATVPRALRWTRSKFYNAPSDIRYHPGICGRSRPSIVWPTYTRTGV
jgi:hypothetical protein